MMKKYEYNGMIYCDEDLSCDIDNYGGDLYDLYYELEKAHEVAECTYYYCQDEPKYYDSIEDLIEGAFDYLEVE